MPDRDFTFEIEEHFGVISSRDNGWNKELNLVRWNGGDAKYDIREWDEHHEQMRRGVTLTQWEMRKLVDLFVSRNNHAAVARGRALEAERNARRFAAKQKAGAPSGQGKKVDAKAEVEMEAAEGAIPPFDDEQKTATVLGETEQAQQDRGKDHGQEDAQEEQQKHII